MRLVLWAGSGAVRAWLRDEAAGVSVELSGVCEVIGWGAGTAARLHWPDDVFVRWERGTVTFPRDQVDVLSDAVPVLQDGRTVEGEA